MSIVVTTPTGHIGSRVARLLIQAGARPTVLARDPARLSEDIRAGSDVLRGDLNDAAFVRRATEGAEALFYLIPANYASDDPIGEMLRLGRNAADAIRANGVARTVFLSSAGAQQKGERDPIGALGRVEELLNATGTSVANLRPGYFYTNLLMDADALRQGVLPTTLPLDLTMPWVDPRDIGDIAAARLLSRDWGGQSVLAVRGPEDLTFARVAALVTEATGRKIEAVRVGDDEARAAMVGAGMGPAAADALVEMSRGIRGGIPEDDGRDATLTGPTPLGAWCYAELRPALLSAPAGG